MQATQKPEHKNRFSRVYCRIEREAALTARLQLTWRHTMEN